MKRCPECRKDYYDETLMYCLDDGSALVQGSVADEPATAILSGEGRTESLGTVAGTRTDPSPSRRLIARERLPWVLVAFFAAAAVQGAGWSFSRKQTSDAPFAARL